MAEKNKITILHICSVENKMANGATVAVLNHVNEQSKTGLAHIQVLHVREVRLNWDESVKVIPMAQAALAIRKADLVVFHEVYYIPYVRLVRWAVKAGTPYVVLPHGSLTQGAQSQLWYAKLVVNVLWARKYIRDAVGIQFLSQKEREVSSGWNRRAFVVPNGVHIPKVWKDVSKCKEKMQFIYIGRINMYYKGLDTLCEACCKLRGFKEQIHFVIYGPKGKEDGAKLEELIIKKGISDIIELKDAVYGEEKEQVMMNADGFIQLSRSEAFGLSIAEAMSYGLPVIVTPGTTFADFVEENDCGWITDGDMESVATTIEIVCSEKAKWRRKSLNARESVENCFEWSKVAKNAIEEYERLIMQEK